MRELRSAREGRGEIAAPARVSKSSRARRSTGGATQSHICVSWVNIATKNMLTIMGTLLKPDGGGCLENSKGSRCTVEGKLTGTRGTGQLGRAIAARVQQNARRRCKWARERRSRIFIYFNF